MKKLLIYIAAFAMILAMNTSCEDMGSLEEHPKKVDATTFMANAKEVTSFGCFEGDSQWFIRFRNSRIKIKSVVENLFPV